MVSLAFNIVERNLTNYYEIRHRPGCQSNKMSLVIFFFFGTLLSQLLAGSGSESNGLSPKRKLTEVDDSRNDSDRHPSSEHADSVVKTRSLMLNDVNLHPTYAFSGCVTSPIVIVVVVPELEVGATCNLSKSQKTSGDASRDDARNGAFTSEPARCAVAMRPVKQSSNSKTTRAYKSRKILDEETLERLYESNQAKDLSNFYSNLKKLDKHELISKYMVRSFSDQRYGVLDKLLKLFYNVHVPIVELADVLKQFAGLKKDTYACVLARLIENRPKEFVDLARLILCIPESKALNFSPKMKAKQFSDAVYDAIAERALERQDWVLIEKLHLIGMLKIPADKAAAYFLFLNEHGMSNVVRSMKERVGSNEQYRALFIQGLIARSTYAELKSVLQWAEVKMTNCECRKVYLHAFSHDSCEAFNVLFSNVWFNSTSNMQFDALVILAAQCGALNCLEYLMLCIANGQAARRFNVMRHASSNGDEHVKISTVIRNASINRFNDTAGHLLLAIAVYVNNMVLVRHLVEDRKVDLSRFDSQVDIPCESCLVYASGNPEMFEYLLANGATFDVLVRDDDMTRIPLADWAAKHNVVWMVELLQNGKDAVVSALI